MGSVNNLIMLHVRAPWTIKKIWTKLNSIENSFGETNPSECWVSVESSPKTRYKIDRPILMCKNTFNVECLALVLPVPLEADQSRKVLIRFTGWMMQQTARCL